MAQTKFNPGNDALRALAAALKQNRVRTVNALRAMSKLVMRQTVENAMHGHGDGATYWKSYSKKYAKQKKGGKRVPVTLKDTGFLHSRWKVITPKGFTSFLQGRNRPQFNESAARFRDAGSGRFVSTFDSLRMEMDIVNDTPYLIYHTSSAPRYKMPLRRPGMGNVEARGFAREGAKRLVRAMAPGRLKDITVHIGARL